jgi:hypothetical protein
MVFAFAHCALVGVKYCWPPYRPVGSRTVRVTFWYGSAFAGATVGLALAAGAEEAEWDGEALAEGDAGAEALAVAVGEADALGVATLRVRRRGVAFAARLAAVLALVASDPADRCWSLDVEPKPPYVAAAAVPAGTTMAAVTTAAKAVGLVLGLRCAPMKLCRASPPAAYRVS